MSQNEKDISKDPAYISQDTESMAENDEKG